MWTSTAALRNAHQCNIRILSQTNLAQTRFVPNTYFNIKFTPTPRTTNLPLLFRFPTRIYACILNLLKPNDIYICRTAALTSRRYILNIYSTNIHTEYFKHAA